MNAISRPSDFLPLSPDQRRQIERIVEVLIALLDAVDGDPDLEPYLAGSAETVGSDDREDDEELEADPTDYDEPGFIWGGQGL